MIIPALLITFGILGHFNGGYPERQEIFSKLQLNNGGGVSCNGNALITRVCSNNTHPQIAILGNSYAMGWVDIIKNKNKKGLVQLTKDSCALRFDDKAKDLLTIQCSEFYEQAFSTIIENNSIETVVISSPFYDELSTLAHLRSFENFLDRLTSKKIVVIGPTPRAPFNVGECLFKSYLLNDRSTCDFDLEDKHIAMVEHLSELIHNTKNAIFFLIINLKVYI